MSKGVFAEFAPRYWDHGLPAVPVEIGTKHPPKDLAGWNGYAASLPNEETRESLLTKYGNRGVGLLLGVRVGDATLIALDADHQRLVAPVLSVLHLNQKNGRRVIAGKKGQKGATYFALVSGGQKVRSQKLKGAAGLAQIDVLAGGKFTVMPPSIHPDTHEAYHVVECDILDHPLEDLVEIEPRQLEVLRAAIGSEHILTLMEGQATHDAGVAFVAKLVAAGGTDEEITALITAALPEGYSGDSLEELPEWISSAREKGFEESGGKRTSLTALLVVLGTGDGVDLFNDGDGNAYASVPSETGFVTYRVRSDGYERWLRHLAYHALEKPVPMAQLRESILMIETMALFDGEAREIFSRIGGDLTRIEIDRGTKDGDVIVIGQSGWAVGAAAKHKFVRGAGFDLLPPPEPGGDLRELQTLLGLDGRTYHLLLAFLLNALKPSGPYFVLLVEGEQGSGKSFFCQVIKMLVDPNKAPRLRLPDNDRDLMIQAKEYWLLSYDNASGMKADMSDALCSLATGGGVAVRKLYSDGELHVMSYARPFMINGISGYVTRPDLMERSLPIKLSPMAVDARKTEAEMVAAFEAIRPRILGALYDAVAAALRNYGGVEPPRHLRMADAAQWIAAGEEALGVEPGTIIAAVTEAQDDFFVERINDDPLVMRLRALTAGVPFEGYVGDLFVKLDAAHDSMLPKTPSHLSNQLKRLRPAMAKAGVLVEFLGKDRGGQRLRITSDPAFSAKSVKF